LSLRSEEVPPDILLFGDPKPPIIDYRKSVVGTLTKGFGTAPASQPNDNRNPRSRQFCEVIQLQLLCPVCLFRIYFVAIGLPVHRQRRSFVGSLIQVWSHLHPSGMTQHPQLGACPTTTQRPIPNDYDSVRSTSSPTWNSTSGSPRRVARGPFCAEETSTRATSSSDKGPRGGAPLWLRPLTPQEAHGCRTRTI
jgi:hypothetical protein